MKDAALCYEIQIPSPQPWVLGWALCSWKVWLAWHLFYWLGRKKSSCIWALSLKSMVRDRKAALASGEENVTALLCRAQFISGHRWGTWINQKLNWALIYIRKCVRNKPWAMLTIKPSLLCYSCCATGCGKGMEHPSAIQQKLEGETDMSFATEMVRKLFELKEQLCVGLQSQLWSPWR